MWVTLPGIVTEVRLLYMNAPLPIPFNVVGNLTEVIR